jgi:hypothetical protein
MQPISSYIAYLLTKHECVIVPRLGAFVVSGPEEQENRKVGMLCPPSKFLGFNPDIRHNDGLLANAIAKAESITYKDACRHLSRIVDFIIARLERQTPVKLASVGKLEQSAERKYIFTPARQLSCNADIFGMDNFYLPSVHELNEEEKLLSQTVDSSDKQPFAYPSLVRRTLSIAATILALLMIAIPVTDHSSGRLTQMANFLPLPVVVPNEPEPAPPVQEPEPTPYYIIIASLPTETSAQLQIEQFRADDLSDFGIVSVGNKHRIYAARFGDKTEANTFLVRFRNEYPQFRDAWLFIQHSKSEPTHQSTSEPSYRDTSTPQI